MVARFFIFLHPIIPQKLLFVKPLSVFFRAKKVFHTPLSSMCKTVENSVDYAENLYFHPFFCHFSPIYAKTLWKTLAQDALFAPFFFSFFL